MTQRRLRLCDRFEWKKNSWTLNYFCDIQFDYFIINKRMKMPSTPIFLFLLHHYELMCTRVCVRISPSINCYNLQLHFHSIGLLVYFSIALQIVLSTVLIHWRNWKWKKKNTHTHTYTQLLCCDSSSILFSICICVRASKR